ncbi:uncharacterized protein LOC111085913 isoform X1 [Limulus polyphemus]|uniref:Uncharacterized protein LOC111085913 isoform X1 n=2 Tax=Limulus polyphemus TaxID=6850 RepID=A0ABM1SFP1_LIMPO|nr:uncharacterized protein LOC111085913 isoform X1 [Limulus polyphemus]
MQRQSNCAPFCPPSKYLQTQWEKQQYERHRRKIKKARPVVDTTAPPGLYHMNDMFKKLHLEKERSNEIQRENDRLLNKMKCIMNSKGTIDCRNDYVSKSLNLPRRRQDLVKTMEENKLLWQKITQQAPLSSAIQWERLMKPVPRPLSVCYSISQTNSFRSRHRTVSKGITTKHLKNRSAISQQTNELLEGFQSLTSRRSISKNQSSKLTRYKAKKHFKTSRKNITSLYWNEDQHVVGFSSPPTAVRGVKISSESQLSGDEGNYTPETLLEKRRRKRWNTSIQVQHPEVFLPSRPEKDDDGDTVDTSSFEQCAPSVDSEDKAFYDVSTTS